MRRVRTGLLCLGLAAAPLAAAAQNPSPNPARPAPKAADKEVQEVTVTGGRPDIQTGIDSRTYTLSKDLQATTGSIADALRNVPSVEVDLQGNLSMRGDPNVTILIDGKPAPQFEGAARAEALQQLPSDQIDRVEVITNPSAAQNPEGSGGVINLITKKSRGAGTTSSVYVTAGSQGLKRAGVNVGYNSKDLNVTGSLSTNYQRNKVSGSSVRTSIDPVTGAERFTESIFIGRNLARPVQGRLNLTYSLAPKTQLTAAASYGHLLFYGYPYNRQEDFDETLRSVALLDRQGRRRMLAIDNSLSAGWKHSFAQPKHEISLDAVRTQNRYRDNLEFITLAERPAPRPPLEAIRDTLTQTRSELKLAYSRPMPEGATLKTGLEVRAEDTRFDYRAARGPNRANLVPETFRDNIYDFDQTIQTAYATYERSFGDLGMQLGLRVEDVDWSIDQFSAGLEVGQHYVRAYPSVHLNYKLDDEQKVSASYSRRVQRPPPQFLNPRRYQFDPRNFQEGNPDLDPQDTHSFEVGYELRDNGAFYSATAYYRRIEDEFSPVLRNLGDNVFLATFDNLGSSQSAGLELVANGKLTSKLSYNASTNVYWTSVDAGNIADGGARDAFGLGGRANLNWQVRADDLIQVNAFMQGKRLLAQGYNAPVYTLNLGWRHKFNDKVTATLTAQDVLGTNRFKRRLDSPRIRERIVNRPVSRALILRLDYRFGASSGRPAREPGFEYEGGGAAATPPS